MTNQTKIAIIIGAILVFIISVVVLWTLFTGDQTSNVTFQTPDGEVVVNNFRETALETRDQSTYLEAEDLFTIYYGETDGTFYLTLFPASKEDAPDVRVAAEQALVTQLGVPEQEVCKLPVNVAIPLNVIPEYAGINYGLSFCEGAINFGSL